MIPKVVERKGNAGFHILGKYILDASQADDSVLWIRTAEYVMDTQGDGEKLAWYRLTHCESDTPAMAIAEIALTQAENTRAKGDKSYHLVISFREGEQPTREQLEDIEDRLCEGLGLGEHQRISAVHKNTDNMHMHIAINKVHPVTHRLIEPYYPYLKLDKLCKELEQKHGLEVDNRIGEGKAKGKAAEMEAHTGEESLLSWVKENLKESLKQVKSEGQSWQDVHSLLAEHDLIIKPRGAGLVIGTKDGKVYIKASSVDRSLSIKVLTVKFGEYAPPLAQERPPENESERQDKPKETYTRRSRDRAPESNSLWGQYQKEKDSAYKARTEALNGIRKQQSEDRIKLIDSYRERRASVKGNTRLDAATKRGVYSELSRQMKADFAKQKTDYGELRRKAVSENPAVTWDAWLVRQAEQGNVDALNILRNRQQTRLKLAQALLTVESFEEAKTIIHPHLKPIVRRDGGVHYRLSDGGVVEDTKEAVLVPQVTEAATVLALSLANERFQGKALKVQGSDDFKRQVAKMAAIKGLNVTFADAGMESDRQMHTRARELDKENTNNQNSRPREKEQERENARYDGR
jgi:hypothetical protein